MLPLFPDWPGTPLTADAVRAALRPFGRSFADSDAQDGLVTLLVALGLRLSGMRVSRATPSNTSAIAT